MRRNTPMMSKTTKLKLLLLFISFSSFLQTILSKSPSEDINWWCNKTPYPDTCKHFISNSAYHFWPRRHSEFRKVLVTVALDRAIHDFQRFLQYKPKCTTKCQKAAWSDCLKLYDYTVHQLNRTLEGIYANDSNCSYEDAQTWLSSALTNIQTCKLGSQDLNVSDFITPIMSHNVSQLLSSSLKINGAMLKASNYHKQKYFPSWVSRLDRRLLLSSSSLARGAHLRVAKDGSGHFRSVQAAINAAARRRRMGRFIIHVKRGVYRENIEVGLNNLNIMLVGDGMRYTIITSSRSVKRGYTTFSSATAGIDGPHFIARDIAFVNAAGPYQGQAVALRSASDLSVFYKCSFEGYQDTLMVHSQRQFYRDCYIYGTIDFIFGNAAVVFQNCVINVRRPLWGQANMITAQGRNDPYQNTGISIQNSIIRPAPDLRPVARYYKTFLGRPWQQYSRTVIIKSYIDGFISPQGWSPWGNSNYALSTLFYGEYKNFGPGASTRYRVRWRGFHVIRSPAQASKFTVNALLAGQTWLRTTGVPFYTGL